MLARQIVTRADMYGEHVVGAERSTSVLNAALENRAPCSARPSGTTSRLPRSDQHVGDVLTERGRVGDRQQVLLAVRRGSRFQIFIIESRRVAQHRLATAIS
jgi:hypothetical protein